MKYQPFYCEENIWWLAQESAGDVVFLTNASRSVAICQQRAGQGPAREVMWDYHVVLVADGQVHDLDCVAGSPLPVARWVAASFPHPLPVAFAPRFRIVPAADFVAQFASDRRHMRRAGGGWNAEPPPWPCIGTGWNLDRYLALEDTIDLDAFVARYARG